MKLKKSTENISLLFNIALLCVFAFFALAVLLSGAKAYRTFAARMDNNFSSRTAAGYLTNKLHQYDTQGGIAITEIGGAPALALTDPTMPDYHTLIYYSDGAIREMFARADVELDPETGMTVAEVEGLAFERQLGGVWVEVQGVGGTLTRFFVAVRSDAV